MFNNEILKAAIGNNSERVMKLIMNSILLFIYYLRDRTKARTRLAIIV